jgi:hypothetical protein
MNFVNNKRRLTLSIRPSLRRILDMDNETILVNYALIVYKASSLSSAQRSFLQLVLQSKLNHGSIENSQVADAVMGLSNAIQKQNEDRDSSNK